METEARCPVCGGIGTGEGYTVDRYGVRHWFRHCSACGTRWPVERVAPPYENPHLHKTPSWRPDRVSFFRTR